MGMIEGAIKREGLTDTLSLSEAGMSDASGDGQDDQGGDVVNADNGESMASRRRDSLMPQETRLIMEMEREAMEAGLGGWFNGNLEDVILESWSGPNSEASASQDQVGTTLLTTIGGRTLSNPVRVPDNMVYPAVLTSLMEEPIQPWQCLVWSDLSPPRYSRSLPDDHTSCPGGILLQVGPSLFDLVGEYRGGGVVEEIEGNKGGGTSIE